MIAPDFLQLLRCPLDPQRQTPLAEEEGHLVCPKCRARFRVRDGIPNLVKEEAELPPGVESLGQLPARHA
jgi:uncharacterized protein